MTRITAEAFSAASPDRVFAYRADPRLIPQWNSTYPALEGSRGDAGQAGSTYTLRRVNGKKLEVRVLEAEKPTRLVTIARQGGINLLQTTTLTAVDGGTRIEAVYDYVVPWSRGGALADRFLRPHIERGLRTSTARLAELAATPRAEAEA